MSVIKILNPYCLFIYLHSPVTSIDYLIILLFCLIKFSLIYQDLLTYVIKANSTSWYTALLNLLCASLKFSLLRHTDWQVSCVSFMFNKFLVCTFSITCIVRNDDFLLHTEASLRAFLLKINVCETMLAPSPSGMNLVYFLQQWSINDIWQEEQYGELGNWYI